MNLVALLLLALSVSMDNFAVSLGIGTAHPVRTVMPMFRVALAFGAFQVLMPLLGWLGGSQVAFLFHGRESWVLCGSLVFVGWRMLRSAQESDEAVRSNMPSLGTVLSLGFATSLDSLVVGFGLAMIHVDILEASGIMGAVAVGASVAGMLSGRQLGQSLGRYSRFSGALVLILIGVRALVSH